MALSSAKFFERYMEGEYEEVWQDMWEFGEVIREEPHYTSAKKVVDEAMRRVRFNVDLIYRRLVDMEYDFDPFGDRRRKPVEPPSPGVGQQLDKIEKTVGILPLTVRSFCEIVGDVDFTGEHPDFEEVDYPDALYFNLLGSIWQEYDDWEVSWYEGCDPLIAGFSPDYYHKSQAGGGGPYAIEIPNPRSDAFVLEEPHELFFIPYLRRCFDWGGFPGFEMTYDEPPDVIKQLSAGLKLF